jgi:hypothetical protein
MKCSDYFLSRRSVFPVSFPDAMGKVNLESALVLDHYEQKYIVLWNFYTEISDIKPIELIELRDRQ